MGHDLAEVSTGGASEASFAGALGLPTLDGLGADGDGAHAERRARAASLAARARGARGRPRRHLSALTCRPCRRLLAVVFWGISFVATRRSSARSAVRADPRLARRSGPRSCWSRWLSGAARRRRVRLADDRADGLRRRPFHQLLQAYALTLTSAVNTGWLIGLTPVWFALLAWLCCGERMSLEGGGRARVGAPRSSSPAGFGAAARAALDARRSPDTHEHAELGALQRARRDAAPRSARHARPRARSRGPVLLALPLFVVQDCLELAPLLARRLGRRALPRRLLLGPRVPVLVRGAGDVEASRVAALLYLEPLVTLAASIALLGERVGVATIAGGLLLLAGVALVQRAALASGGDCPAARRTENMVARSPSGSAQATTPLPSASIVTEMSVTGPRVRVSGGVQPRPGTNALAGSVNGRRARPTPRIASPAALAATCGSYESRTYPRVSSTIAGDDHPPIRWARTGGPAREARLAGGRVERLRPGDREGARRVGRRDRILRPPVQDGGASVCRAAWARSRPCPRRAAGRRGIVGEVRAALEQPIERDGARGRRREICRDSGTVSPSKREARAGSVQRPPAARLDQTSCHGPKPWKRSSQSATRPPPGCSARCGSAMYGSEPGPCGRTRTGALQAAPGARRIAKSPSRVRVKSRCAVPSGSTASSGSPGTPATGSERSTCPPASRGSSAFRSAADPTGRARRPSRRAPACGSSRPCPRRRSRPRSSLRPGAGGPRPGDRRRPPSAARAPRRHPARSTPRQGRWPR